LAKYGFEKQVVQHTRWRYSGAPSARPQAIDCTKAQTRWRSRYMQCWRTARSGPSGWAVI